MKMMELPEEILVVVDELIEKLGLWPRGRIEFIEEAVLEKIRGEQARLSHLEKMRKEHRQRTSYRVNVLDELLK